MMRPEVESAEAGDWATQTFRGVAAMAFGVLALVWPSLTLTALVLLFGIFVLADGILTMISVFTTRADEATSRRALRALQGVISIAAAVVTFVWPGITALALLYVIAAWAIVTGVLEVVAAVRLRHEMKGEWLLALGGVVSVLFGVALIAFPGAGALAITWLIGWYAILYGVVNLVRAVQHYRQSHPGGMGAARRQATA